MSAGNMGISQLECLQLRNLVGSDGIGAFKSQVTEVNTVVPITQNAAGEYQGTYTSTFTVPSGTGLIRLGIRTSIYAADNVKFYFLKVGTATQATLVPTFDTYQGFSYWFTEETIIYNNPSSSPAPLSVVITTTQAVTCTVFYFEADIISFGPYVQQD